MEADPSPEGTEQGRARHRVGQKLGVLICSRVLQPQDLESPPAHAFKMTSFKKVKACGICRQAITRQGSTCRGEETGVRVSERMQRCFCTLLHAIVSEPSVH